MTRKLVIFFLSSIVLSIGYTNCAPSFQSESDITSNGFESDSFFGGGSGPLDDGPPAFNNMVGTGGLIEKLASSETGYDCSSVTTKQELYLLNNNLGPLTNRQYENTIRSLFGVNVVPDLPNDYDVKTYNTSLGKVTPGIELVESFFSTALKVIDAIDATAAAKAKVYNCSGANDTQCLNSFIKNWGRLLFKRPLSLTEENRIKTIVSSEAGDINAKLSNSLYLMLVAPQFTYHNYGTDLSFNDSRKQKINEYELASRLSFFIWGETPDEGLLNLARDNKLRSQLSSVVEAMLNDGRSIYLARELHIIGSQWVILEILILKIMVLMVSL